MVAEAGGGSADVGAAADDRGCSESRTGGSTGVSCIASGIPPVFAAVDLAVTTADFVFVAVALGDKCKEDDDEEEDVEERDDDDSDLGTVATASFTVAGRPSCAAAAPAECVLLPVVDEPEAGGGLKACGGIDGGLICVSTTGGREAAAMPLPPTIFA